MSDYFYDGQIRRYVTQFMRIFIGFKWESADGVQQSVPVLYGDMSRQVANIIKENSENKMISVPKIACYITGLELDKTRLSDSSFVSKVNIRERQWTENAQGQREYQNTQGKNYTVERLMPTPFKLTMKADIWTSNTDQKLQLLEQITVLFNPSIELQTTDNYLDWTSLSVVDLTNLQFSTRNVPQGVDTEIDIATLTFEMPVWITPPAKVKRLGVVQTIISNVFTDSGSIVNLENLIFNRATGRWGTNSNNFSVLLFKSNNGETFDYDVTIVNPGQAVLSLGLNQRAFKLGEPVDWAEILEVLGGVRAGSQMYFKQPNGYSLIGTFAVNPIDPSTLVVTFDPETIPRNTKIDSQGRIWGYDSRGIIYQDEGFDESTSKELVDSIVNPQRYNPITTFGGLENIPLGYRLLLLDDIGAVKNVDGADAWAEYIDITNPTGDPSDKDSELIVKANSIIEWTGKKWRVVFDPAREYPITVIIQNFRTLIKYRWDGEQWLKAFEGEYRSGTWGLVVES